MTFKDLKKRVSLEATTKQQSKLFERLYNKSFWIWHMQQHKQEDIKTDGIAALITLLVYHRKMEMINPVYDYERIIFESLDTHNSNKHLLIKKATGLGISEFMLRFMAWLCLKDNALSGSLICIVTGPRIDLALALTQRMKEVLTGKGQSRRC